MPGEESATWAGNLRMKSSLAATRLLLRSEGSDRFRAAEALQHDMDRTASGLTQSLKLGERLSRTMRRPPEIMSVLKTVYVHGPDLRLFLKVCPNK